MKKYITILIFILLTLNGCSQKSNQETSFTEQGINAIENKSYDEALTYFETAASNGEDEQLVFRGKGIAYIGKGEYETAIENLKLALKKATGKVNDLEIDTSYYLALAQYKNSDREGAIQTYTNILAFDEEDANAYYLRGTVYLADGNLESAISDFDKAIQSDSDEYEMYVNIFNNLDNKGYTTQGQDYLKKALEIKDSKDDGLKKGMIYYYLGDTENALTQLNKSKEAGNKQALLYLGKVYQLLKDNATAVGLYEEYIAAGESKEGLGTVYNMIGMCNMENESYQEALTNFQSGIALNESDSMQELLFNEIVSYEYLSDFETAAQKMQEYLNLYPNDNTAKREYDFLKTR
ncbi:tetratricopeptide repeat protein [Lachnotalea glycerini]|uniref:Tetratricopeptide repeat protein n=1 Tax=Lachnotalea glycerini TaxID=1763509 RepID=A0A318EPV4_9FIRM|nr:tetratricopeptide repeat protein [Lachnotalea glycerini]PXV89078.1 tetratricopeptide repeat protein [Lachnotalea glycerini]